MAKLYWNITRVVTKNMQKNSVQMLMRKNDTFSAIYRVPASLHQFIGEIIPGPRVNTLGLTA